MYIRKKKRRYGALCILIIGKGLYSCGKVVISYMNFGAPFKRLKNLKVECKCDSYMLPANISTFLRDAETIDAEYIKMGERSEEGIVGNYIFIFLFLFAV